MRGEFPSLFAIEFPDAGTTKEQATFKARPPQHLYGGNLLDFPMGSYPAAPEEL